MKAYSRGDLAAAAAGGVSTLLAVFFWLPAGGRMTLMPPVGLAGKTWVLHEAAPPPAPRRPAADAPPPARAPRHRKPPRHRREVPAPRPAARPAAPVPGIVRSTAAAAGPPTAASLPPLKVPPNAEAAPVAAASVLQPGMLDPLDRYTVQELIDGYESDPSRYPMGRTVRSGSLALTLEGLELRDKLCVLKVSVANSGGVDAFLKEFAVRTRAGVLASRSIFRILVEAARSREGYVVFVTPPSGAAVQIRLKEDGGKGRSIEMGVPYRF